MAGSNCMMEEEGRVGWKFETDKISSVEGLSMMVLVARETSRK